MTLTNEVCKRIIEKLLKGEDYRIEIVNLLNACFLDYVVDFFKRIVALKLEKKRIDMEWYRKEFLSEKLTSDEIAIHSGLNRKTITNMYNTGRREVVIDVAHKHLTQLYELIDSLVDPAEELHVHLTIELDDVFVRLNLNETLIVVNTLAVKRAAIRGGLWSTAGKQVEAPLMNTLCMLHRVPEKQFRRTGAKSLREADFYLIDGAGQEQTCEVKLMGKGNPESADAPLARGHRVFVADKLSDKNKMQLSSQGVEWVELRSADGYKRFAHVLEQLEIPHTPFSGDLDAELVSIFGRIF